MHSYKLYISLIATLIGLISYVPYVSGMVRRTVKPSTASWTVWGILTAVAFGAQLSAGGGIGTLSLGVSALICFILVGLAIRTSRQKFTKLDWACLAAALGAIALWVLARDPLWSILIVIGVTFIGYVPTYYKSIDRPHDENATTYALGSVKFAASIASLGTFTAATTLYPVAMIAANGGLLAFLIVRRKKIDARTA
jgi:hypothetical protein